MNASVSFVVESGRLEAQAVLLAASLRAWHPDLALVAATSQRPSEDACRILADLRVRLVPIANPVADDYPIGNKVAALGAGEPNGTRLFLDTDTLCLRPLVLDALAGHAFAAKPADIGTFGDLDTWATLYRRFGLPVPVTRIAATVSEVLMPPYFNAGMLVTTAAQALAEAWARTCVAVDRMADINPRRPWLDQIALPIAVAQLGLDSLSLDETWNFPAHMKPLSVDAAIVHYHQPTVVAREPRLVDEVRRILECHPAIRPILAADAAWVPVLGELARTHAHGTSTGWSGWRRRRPPRARHRGLIISGIPRSGTSYLAKLLDGCADVAAINEPEILIEWLRYSRDPWIVPILHADLRRRIDAGEAVENKLGADGELVEDTAVADQRCAWTPRLRSRDWVLATKNTLAYMARLEGILRLMPDARVALCIRHPLDTLASWKGTFQHLATGDPTPVPVGGLADPFLPARFRDALQTIASVPDAACRRAAWWRLLAQEILRWRERVVVVRYEDLMAAPARELARVLGPWSRIAGIPRGLVGSAPRTARRHDLEPADYAAVAAECADLAVAFGYAAFQAPGSQGASAARSPVTIEAVHANPD